MRAPKREETWFGPRRAVNVKGRTSKTLPQTLTLDGTGPARQPSVKGTGLGPEQGAGQCAGQGGAGQRNSHDQESLVEKFGDFPGDFPSYGRHSTLNIENQVGFWCVVWHGFMVCIP